jgi:hypothetical protein
VLRGIIQFGYGLTFSEAQQIMKLIKIYNKETIKGGGFGVCWASFGMGWDTTITWTDWVQWFKWRTKVKSSWQVTNTMRGGTTWLILSPWSPIPSSMWEVWATTVTGRVGWSCWGCDIMTAKSDDFGVLIRLKKDGTGTGMLEIIRSTLLTQQD